MRDTPDMDEDEEDNDTDPWGEPDEYDLPLGSPRTGVKGQGTASLRPKPRPRRFSHHGPPYEFV